MKSHHLSTHLSGIKKKLLSGVSSVFYASLILLYGVAFGVPSLFFKDNKDGY